MPACGPVYQPTTVSYEQQNCAWMRPGGFISHSLSSRIRSPRFLQWILLILMIICFIVGLSMIIDGSLMYSKTSSENMVHSDGGGSSTIIVVGILLLVIGLIFAGFFLKLMRRRRACPCFPNKEERLARQLDSQGGNGQILTQNPSTDLLVTAQYAPVSEIAYQPPATTADHEETSKLMPSDLIKDWLRAPLATLDDLTPSLRSSASSLFYQRSMSSFYPSDSSSDTIPLSSDPPEALTSPAPPYHHYNTA